ncbi:MAG: hypothetical protein HYZ14_11220 [Bacteroidetes bacterium]|nr:hypothetical protein [Bacteroidota bacterium]
MKPVYCISFIFLFACGGEPAGTTDHSLDGKDTIKEFEMSEPRLTAVEFNNEMTFMQDAILSQVDELFKSDSSNIDLNLENTLFEIDLNLESLNNMKVPENGEAFLNAMKNLMNFYHSELTGPFQQIVPLLKKADWSKADEKQVSVYDVSFVESEKAWFDSVFAEQEKFAKANNIKLETAY